MYVQSLFMRYHHHSLFKFLHYIIRSFITKMVDLHICILILLFQFVSSTLCWRCAYCCIIWVENVKGYQLAIYMYLFTQYFIDEKIGRFEIYWWKTRATWPVYSVIITIVCANSIFRGTTSGSLRDPAKTYVACVWSFDCIMWFLLSLL